MKDELRYKYKIKRKYFQYSAREVADGCIFDNVLAAFGDCKSFLIYYSFGSEADTHALIDRLLALEKQVYLPRVEGQNIVPVRYMRGDILAEGAHKIMQPRGQAYEGDIDVCITPLLCVNSKGARLGYGGGYYDRFFKSHPDILRVGVGYYLQYSDEFEEEEHDELLDKFVCERGIIDFAGRRF